MTVHHIEFVVWTATSVWLLFMALRSRQSLLSWHMFAGYSHCRLSLTYHERDGKVQTFNPWDFLPHSMLAMKERDLIVLLTYVERIHRLQLDGEVEFTSDAERKILKVVGSRVDR